MVQWLALSAITSRALGPGWDPWLRQLFIVLVLEGLYRNFHLQLLQH